MKLINKTMDRGDLFRKDCLKVIEELEALMRELKRRELKYGSWLGVLDLQSYQNRLSQLFNECERGTNYESFPNAFDDINIPWFKYWEISWIYMNSGVKKGDEVLDMGGSSSLFSFYLAHKGCKVFTIDIKGDLVQNANYVAKKMGWEMRNAVINMLDIEEHFEKGSFDYIFSICVFEHLESNDRIKVMSQVERLLKSLGQFCITFDYLSPCKNDFIGPVEIYQFINSSGLKVIGNQTFFDNKKRYFTHPFFCKKLPLKEKIDFILEGGFSPLSLIYSSRKQYTIGSLFTEKQ